MFIDNEGVDIDRALDNGYRVIASDVWTWSRDELAGHLGSQSAADRADAVHRMLHEDFNATPAFSDPVAGNFYELIRR